MTAARPFAALLPAALLLSPLAAQPATTDPVALPLEQRQAVIGVLDKRQGKAESFSLKPGERFRFGRISGILRSCETSKPYERKQSAAYVQVDEQGQALAGRTPPPKRIFSGWLFAEAPSRNPVEHPVYDVWLKSCTMYAPDTPAPASSSGATASGGAVNPAAPSSGGPESPASASEAATPAASPG